MLNKITLLFIISSILFGCKKDNNGIKPKITKLTESVYSSVTIQPDSLYEVYSVVSGILDNTFVTEGDNVTIGSPLVQIINTMPKLNAQNAKIALQQAQLNAGTNSTILGGIQDEIKTAKLKLANDKLNYQRQKSLWDKNIGSKAQLDAQRLIFETTETQVKMMQDRYKRTSSELKTALNQASVQYKSAETSTKDFAIQSRMIGKVYALNAEPGEIINPQKSIASIGSSNNFILEMLIDEVDITKLELGQKIILTLDAYKKQAFEAKITKIYPAKDERNQTFKVEGEFTTLPKKLYPGLTGEANIIIAQRDNVLTIPNEYINAEGMVNTDDGLTPITIGLQSMQETEVLSGIDSSTVIYKPE
jgi:multidrug efflux pump subunit AcrA (membrane-fusion protein)